MTKYFAYGSNMDKDDIDSWCDNHGYPRIVINKITPVVLNGYKLIFNYYSHSRGGGAANIVKSSNDCVYGLLMEIDNRDKDTISTKEGAPDYYHEIKVDVVTFNGEIFSDVLTYQTIKEKEKREIQLPTKYYMDLIINNAKKYNFPEEYLRYLNSIPIKHQNK